VRISKSKFVAGVQCLKRLYFQVHSPELAGGVNETTEAVIEQGRKVGLLAQKAFPGGVTVTADQGRLDDAVRITRELVANTEVPAIFEGTFEHGTVLVRTDILKRRDHLSHELIEVKSATDIKPQYLYDLGIQEYVLANAGVKVERSTLMHLNREYVFDGNAYDVSRLFVAADLPPERTISQAEISHRVTEQLRILDQPTAPDVKPGRQCSEPVVCEFYDHCNPALPSDHVSTLPRMHAGKLDELLSLGITSVAQIPDGFPLSDMQRRAIDAIKTGKMWVSPELAAELSSLQYPICFMYFRNGISGTSAVCRNATVRSPSISMVCSSSRATRCGTGTLRVFG